MNEFTAEQKSNIELAALDSLLQRLTSEQSTEDTFYELSRFHDEIKANGLTAILDAIKVGELKWLAEESAAARRRFKSIDSDCNALRAMATRLSTHQPALVTTHDGAQSLAFIAS